MPSGLPVACDSRKYCTSQKHKKCDRFIAKKCHSEAESETDAVRLKKT